MKTKDTPYFLVQSVDRAFTIFEVFIRERKPLGITEVAEEVKLHKSVVHRLLATMKSHQLLNQDPNTGKYEIGPRAFELGSVYMDNSLFNEGKRFLPELAEKVGETAHLAILQQGSVLYLVNQLSPKPFLLTAPIGVRNPVNVTALGKALVAWKPEEEVIDLLHTYGMVTVTANSIRTVSAFLEELEKVRKNGYAVDDEENGLGQRCVAAPLRDQTGDVVAAISVGGSTKLIAPENIEEVADLVISYARMISDRLGYISRNVY